MCRHRCPVNIIKIDSPLDPHHVSGDSFSRLLMDECSIRIMKMICVDGLTCLVFRPMPINNNLMVISSEYCLFFDSLLLFFSAFWVWFVSHRIPSQFNGQPFASNMHLSQRFVNSNSIFDSATNHRLDIYCWAFVSFGYWSIKYRLFLHKLWFIVDDFCAENASIPRMYRWIDMVRPDLRPKRSIDAFDSTFLIFRVECWRSTAHHQICVNAFKSPENIKDDLISRTVKSTKMLKSQDLLWRHQAINFDITEIYFIIFTINFFLVVSLSLDRRCYRFRIMTQ